jgi:hypothetical protein
VARRRACNIHARWPHRQYVEHVAGARVGMVGTFFGLATGQIGPRSKSKVEAHELLYTFHLRAMVIRVLHQWLIKLQNGTVNKLTMIQVELGFLGVLGGQTWSNEFQLFTCSSPRCKVQILYLAQLELLNKNSRTRDAKHHQH